MSAYGTFPLLRDPKGLANTVGAAHTRVRHVAGVQGKTSCTLTRNVGSPPTCKGQAATRFASQALTGFQLRPLRLVLLPHGDGEGQGRRSRAFLTPWNRPTLTVGVGG